MYVTKLHVHFYAEPKFSLIFFIAIGNSKSHFNSRLLFSKNLSCFYVVSVRSHDEISIFTILCCDNSGEKIIKKYVIFFITQTHTHTKKSNNKKINNVI